MMFGNSKKTAEPKSSATVPSSSSSNAINSLVSGTRIKGNVNAQNDIRIDGELEGDLQCSGRVIIGAGGKVTGEINCQNAIIEGSFDGTIVVNEILDVRESGHVTGDVNTNKLVIEPGAVFNVNCNMSGQKIKSITPASEA